MDVALLKKTSSRLSKQFLSLSRPPSYWDVAGVHLPLALVTGIALFLANWVPCDILPLRHCTFLQFTGYPCPFCGFTRSFWAIADGDWAFAMQNCPLSCLIYIATVLVFGWNTTALLFNVRIRRGPLLRLSRVQARLGIYFVIMLFVLNWIYRLSNGLK